ncbi:MAG: hypothetical protein M4579_003173 [Chaenotheca gracillima]|nr:MAG: hypothetical protein M4579_003173 [Chaenotheca gracillima]
MADTSNINDGGAAPVEALFSSVRFSVVRSEDLTEDRAREVKSQGPQSPETLLTWSQLIASMEKDGGQYHPPSSATGKIIVEEITHIISSISDFPEYLAATEALVSVVRPAWVIGSQSKRRLATTRQYNPDPQLFFGGVTITCADLPSGDKEAIIGGVIAMGGQYSASLSKMVTHIVALTEDNDPCKIAKAKGLKCKIVLPHWFDDCLRLGKRIDERPYTIPDPEITRKSTKDPVDLPADSHLLGASSPHTMHLPSPRESPSALRRSFEVFDGKHLRLASDLELGDRLRRIIEDLICQGRGSITQEVSKADVLICRYREGKEYQDASRAGKDVGNLSWLYYLITHNAWTSPLRRLLHYPVSRRPIPGFDQYRISLSNYGGEARIYLENLVWAAGGQFTKTMKQDNTHLVTARAHSEKYEAAQEWNINIINHLWLEESYAKWQVQSLTNPRYTHFPARTNLGEVVGHTQIDRQALEALFFPPRQDAESASEEEEETSSANKQLQHENVSAISRSSEGPQEESTPASKKVRKVRAEAKTPKTPVVSKLARAGKENETPTSTGSRGAKDRAVAKLHDLAPDMALYEKEKKRVGGVIRGGRKKSDEVNNVRKRSMSVEEDDLDEFEEQDAKRAKKGRAPPTMKVVVTSYNRWVGEVKQEEEDKRRLRELGILMIQDPSHCTHVAAPAIVRTQKFVSALAYGPIILSTTFLDHCLANDELPSHIEKFLLKDPTSEKRHGLVLSAVLKRAKANRRRLFRGISVYCTPNVHGGYETYKAIIGANGGTCQLYRARQGAVASKAMTAAAIKAGGINDRGEGDIDELSADDELDEIDIQDAVYLLSSESSEDRELRGKFLHMARESGRKPFVVRTEWLLDSAMAQEIKDPGKYALGG